MTENELSRTVGQFAYVGDFKKLRKQVGFRRASVSLFVRYRYIVRLYLIRDLAIYQILIENYDKIPKRTWSRFLISIFVRFAFLKNLINKTVNRLQNKLIINT